MLNRIAMYGLVCVAILSGAYVIDGFRGLGAAHADTVMVPADAGMEMGSGSDVTPAPEAPKKADDIKDPVEDAGGFYADVKDAKKRGGWLAALLVMTYALCKLLGKYGGKIKTLAFLTKGRIGMIIAVATTVVASGIDAIFLGGTIGTVMAAMLIGLIGMLGTKPTVPATTE